MKKLGGIVIFFILLSAGILVLHFYKPGPEPPEGKKTAVPSPPSTKTSPPLPPPAPILPPPLPPPPLKTEAPARIAIIIDDLGFSAESARLVLSLEVPFTVSVLPFYPYSKKSAELARNSGKEVLLHIPMEPINTPDEAQPGKGVLISGSSPEEIGRQVGAELSELPFVSGVSSHMGSLFTTDSEGMRALFQVLHQQGLFFVDNLTTNKTVTKKVAGEVGLKYFQRNVFIDNVLSRDSIIKQLELAEKIARRKGQAIAVGHPHPETVSALKAWIPKAKAAGITFVRVSELFERKL